MGGRPQERTDGHGPQAGARQTGGGRAAPVPQQAGDGLAPFRARLDKLDEQIARLLGERFDVCRGVAAYKSEHEIPMMQPQRVAHVRARYLERGAEVGLPADFTESLFELLIAATCKLEDELIAEAGDGAGAAETAEDATAVGDGSPRR